ncbi:MAG: hypothetical protein U1E05_21950 [Patescibacteria group bacterium]|nr:hypothetical protein [Patescibacteria group bacterium]
MTIHQRSVFLAKKPGHLGAICRTLADAQVSMLTLTRSELFQGR